MDGLGSHEKMHCPVFHPPVPSLSQDPAILTASSSAVVPVPAHLSAHCPGQASREAPQVGQGVSDAHLGRQWLAQSAFSGCSVYLLPLQLLPSSASVTSGQGYSSPTCRHHLFLPGLQRRAQIHSTSWVGLKSPVHMSRPTRGSSWGSGADLK